MTPSNLSTSCTLTDLPPSTLVRIFRRRCASTTPCCYHASSQITPCWLHCFSPSLRERRLPINRFTRSTLSPHSPLVCKTASPPATPTSIATQMCSAASSVAQTLHARQLLPPWTAATVEGIFRLLLTSCLGCASMSFVASVTIPSTSRPRSAYIPITARKGDFQRLRRQLPGQRRRPVVIPQAQRHPVFNLAQYQPHLSQQAPLIRHLLPLPPRGTAR